MESGPSIVKDSLPTGAKVLADGFSESEKAGSLDLGGGQPAYAGGNKLQADNQSQSQNRSKVKPPKLYRIGEVVDYSGMSRQTVHNYTIMGLLHESKWTSGGHRLYDESVFERLDQIAEMKSKNMSMEEIREHFTLANKP